VLVSAFLAISNRSLNKIHALLALLLSFSPPWLYITLRVLLSLIRRIRGSSDAKAWLRGKQIVCISVTSVIWISLYVYTFAPISADQFSQPACDREYYFINPLAIFSAILLLLFPSVLPMPVGIWIIPASYCVLVVLLHFKEFLRVPRRRKWTWLW
jgi:hypothetical protein